MSSATSHDQQRPLQQGHEQAPPKPRVKKQARRRMHASKPYQERLLNMAEARREIVTALRIHRANMRQQSRYHEQEQQQPRFHEQPVQVMLQEESQAFEGVPVAMSYASSFSSKHLCSSSLSHLIDGAPVGNYSSSMLSYGLTPFEDAPAAVGGLEQLPCTLSAQAQPLGLNLSFQGFGGSPDCAKNSDDPFGVPLIPYLSPCPAASSYSSPVTAIAGHGSLLLRATEDFSSWPDAPAASSPVLDAERRGMEWSEAATNVAAASAWWTKIIEGMESGGVRESAAAPQLEGEVGMADDAVAAAGLLPEWQWLCDGAGVGVEQEVTGPNKPDVLEMHVDDGEYSCCYEGNHRDNGGHDIGLPCVHIGDMEGWDDGEWFS